MSIPVTSLWAINFQMAVSAGDYRAARCIPINQLAGYPSLDWRRYVTAEQATAIESTIIDVSIAPEPFQSVKPRKKKGDDVIVTITAGSTKLVMTGAELREAGQAAKRKRGA
jgi:hypothetical protein